MPQNDLNHDQVNKVSNALYAAHAVIREGVHEDRSFQKGTLRVIENALAILGVGPPEADLTQPL